MQTVIKASDPADLLAMLPSLAGFVPHESLVLLAFHGKRTCGAMRFDLPASTNATALKRFATSVVGVFCRLKGADGVAVAVFTDASVGETTRLPYNDYAHIVERRLVNAGYPVRELLCQAGDGWGSYLDPDLPAGGRPLTDITRSPAMRAMPDELRNPPPLDPRARIEDAAAEVMTPFGERMRHVRQTMNWVDENIDAVETYLEGADGDGDYDYDIDAVRDLTDVLHLYGKEASLDDFSLSAAMDDLSGFVELVPDWDDEDLDSDGPTLMTLLQGPPMRDTTMLQWAFGRQIGELGFSTAPMARDDRGEPVPRSDLDHRIDLMLSHRMMGQGPRPDPERLTRCIRILRTLVSRTRAECRPAPLCMLAWMSWALGSNTAAGAYLNEVRSIDPGYGMAEVLTSLIGTVTFPEWAFEGPL
jgi:hypothetical protein